MQIGVIGLGRMGANISGCLMQAMAEVWRRGSVVASWLSAMRFGFGGHVEQPAATP